MHFTVEEENLICLFHNAYRRLTDTDYDNQKFNFTDE